MGRLHKKMPATMAGMIMYAKSLARAYHHPATMWTHDDDNDVGTRIS